MSRVQRLLGAVLVGLLVLAGATVGGIVTSDRSAVDAAVGRNEIAANGAVQGRLYPGDPAAEAALVDREAERIELVRSVAATVPSRIADTEEAYRLPTSPLPTLVLPAREASYTLEDLQALAPTTFVAEGDGRYLLSEHVMVLPGAKFSLATETPITIELQSNAWGYASFVTVGADVRITGTEAAPVTFASRAGGPDATDTDTSDGRAYVRIAGGAVDLQHARFTDLGFWSGNTGGLSLTGLDEVSDGSDDPPLTAQPESSDGATNLSTEQLEALTADDRSDEAGVVTGSMQYVESTGNAFGIFVSQASELAISGSRVRDSLVDGIVLHRDVVDSSIRDTESAGNAVDGIVVERSSSRLELTGITAERNGRNGVSIDGRPLADGPSAQGTAVEDSGGIRLTGGVMSGNARYGVDVTGGTDIAVTGSTISGNAVGIVLANAATGVDVSENRFDDQPRAIAVRGGVEDTTIRDNEITAADTGVHVRSSSVAVEDNRISDISNHGISMVGSVDDASVSGNEIAGDGSSAIHHDADGAGGATISGNDTEGWAPPVTTGSVIRTLSQPLTVVWGALGLLLLFTALAGHRRATRDPYAERVPLTALSRGIVPVEQLKGRNQA